ncbi:MAG: DUF2785 domain-containing protein [Chloroflexota bacterium]|nr:DUF2785 domain-containing protein [Chloroflexota bacterium]
MTTTSKMLWQTIVDADYIPPQDRSVQSLTPELLSNLGSSDAELRGVFAYPILERWISQERYTPAELRAMITELTQNLALSPDERGTDNVFLRSFSALTLATILYFEIEHPFLEEGEVRQVLEQALAYYPAEQDVRGYVPGGPGWIHAVAHGADLLGVLGLNRYMQVADLERMMEALATKIAPPVAHVYLYNEEQRLVRAVLWLLSQDLLTLPFISYWLERLTTNQPEGYPISVESLLEGFPPAIESDVNTCILHNTRQFLNALYYHLVTADPLPSLASDLIPLLLEKLGPINAF